MSGNLGPQASTKGETTSKTTSKTGYERLDINKLYKGKTAEPVAKTVTQKHGMQTLGKAPPARRAGVSIVKSESTSNDTNNSSVPTQQQQQQTPSSNLGQNPQHQKWANSTHPPGPPSPLNAPNVPAIGQQIHEKNWSGPDPGNYQSQRFAQEFPTLDAGSEPTRGSLMNSGQQLPSATGVQNTSKSQDNQYGPGPILRPQTEGSWIQGGGRQMPRPPGPPAQNAQIREPGPERPNLGGPTPPPMSLGQGGPPPPPPLGSYQMQFRGMPPFMYPNQNSGPPGPGFYPPPGQQGMPRYGMPVPPGAPPTRDHSEGHRENQNHQNRGRPPPPMRPTQQFAVKPILKQEDLKRMDDIDLEGSWASVRDDVDYNKRISFSDDEEEKRGGDPSRKTSERKMMDDEHRSDHRERKPVRILERQISSHDRDHRYENKEQVNYDQDNEDDWNKRRSNNTPYDIKDRGTRKVRDPRDEDWRGNNRFEEDSRNKKGPQQRMDPRGPPDFVNKQYNSNLPPRLQRQQQQHTNQPFTGNQRKTPSPVTTVVSGKDRDKVQSTTQIRILERNRGDSESSNNSIREKRGGKNDYDSRPYDKEPINRLNSEGQREKENEIESLKEKMESIDIRVGDIKRGTEESKAAFRAKSGFSSSWADEVDDDEYSKDFEESRKSSYISPLKPDAIQMEERTVPKRVYIQQRKVENMTTPKVEPQPEPKQSNDSPKQQQQQQENKPTERQRPTAWGEREAREKSRSDTDNNVSPGQKGGEDERERSAEPPKEIILSEKAKQLIQHNNREDNNIDKSDKMQQQQQEIERPTRDFDRKDRNERNERHDYEKGKYSQKIDPRQERGDRSNNYNKDRQQQQRPGRWGSNDFRRDNRTPEKDFNQQSSGRSSATDSSASMTSAKVSNEGSEINNRSTTEKVKNVEVASENSPSFEKEHYDGNKDSREDLKSKDHDKQRERDMDKRNRYPNDDADMDNRGGKGVRNRERVGHGVYQPRGGWGRQEPQRGNKARGGRDHYDNRGSNMRRNDFDREKEGGTLREERDSDSIKENPHESEIESTNEDGKNIRDGTLSEEDRSKREADQNKKSSKSPVSNKKNIRGGGSRLQGYGPPSDKNPFSSGNSNKEEETNKEKQPEQPVSNKNNNPPPTTAPVPLMELGDISPPNMPSRPRHHGGRGGRGGITQERRMQEAYPYRGGGGSKRGRGDAKPLMSITSNELERNEWERESGSESGDEEVKKNTSSSGSKSKKESKKVPQEKLRQNDTRTTKDTKAHSSSANGFEQSNHILLEKSGTSNSDLDSYSSAIVGEPTRPGSTSDNSIENVDGESYQSGNQNKKNIPNKDKSNFSSSNKNHRNDKQQQQQPAQGQGQNANKERRVKNPPYEVRPSTAKDIPPRFQKQQHGTGQSQFSNSKDTPSSASKESNQTTVNAWEKPVTSSAKLDHNSQPPTQNSPSLNTESKDSSTTEGVKQLAVGSSVVNVSAGNAMLDGSGGPLKTMIFENRNFKSVSKPTGSVKLNESNKDLTSSLDLPRDINLGIGKNVNEDSPELDFATAFDDQNNLQPQTSHSSKPMPIGQSRTYSSHQPSPISPLAADLNEKIQSVKRVWDPPSMPSVAEQTSVCTSEESNTFHGGFGSDSFKSNDSANRDFSSSLQQPTSGYAPGHSPALSAISKPDSSTSPNSTNLRQVKPQQQSGMENQSHGGMSSSPFAYSMPQQHQGGAFGGIPAVPSPPAVMYGTSQTMHGGGPHSGVYQAFPHVEPSQVMNSSARTQFGQYSNPQSAGSGYGLGASIFMTSMDAGGYQPFQHSHQQQHSQSGPQGQAPNQSTRISPGPMSTTGGGSGGGVMMNSSNLKSQGGTGTHPNLTHQHQVMSGNHNQQAYSQLSHHHANAMTHHQHPVGPVGPNKGTGYTQSGIATQSQLFIPYDPNQSVINLGQNYISSGIRSAPPGGPPPSQTPPVQTLQATSTYYSGNAGNQVYHTGSNQGGNLQQLHVAVAPNPQALQNLQTATQQFGLQFQSPLNLQYNQQAASTVSALNLGGQLIRSGPPGHSHYNMKQPGLELVQQSHSQLKSHESMMNQAWNTQGFSLNQGFHTGSKSASNVDNRNAGNNIGNQRKGNHQQMGNMGNMGGGGMKYMSNTSGYPTQQKGGRFPAPGPIQRPVSTPSTGPPGSLNSMNPSGVPQSTGSGAINKPKHLTNLNKHLNQTATGGVVVVEEGLLDKFITESGQRSISATPDPGNNKVINMPGSRLIEDPNKDQQNGAAGGNPSLNKNPNLTISTINKSPITSSEK